MFNEKINAIKNNVQNQKKTKNVNIFNKKFKKLITHITIKMKFINYKSIFNRKNMKIEFLYIFKNFKKLKKILKFINIFANYLIIHFLLFLQTKILILKKK